MKTYVYVQRGVVVLVREFRDADLAESYGMRVLPNAAILAPLPSTDPKILKRALQSEESRTSLAWETSSS